MSKHSIFTRNGEYITRDGLSFATEEAAIAHSEKRRAELSQRLGRPITNREWGVGAIPASDSRTYEEQYADEKWSPKIKTDLSPLDRQIAELERAGAKKREAEEFKGLNREESMALILRKKREREEGEQQAADTKAAHLKAVGPKLEVVNQLIFDENFNPQSDEKFRQLLRKTKLSLEEPEADSAEVARLFKAVDAELIARQANRDGQLQQEQQALDAAQQLNSEPLTLLTDPEPQKSEHEPDPHGYKPPQIDPASPEPDKPIVKVEVNRDQTAVGIAFDLCEVMESSGAFSGEQVSEVRRAAIAGDGLDAVIDKYAL